jgi:outer membrane protein TolC
MHHLRVSLAWVLRLLSLYSSLAFAQPLPPFQYSSINFKATTLSNYIAEVGESNNAIQVKKIGAQTAIANLNQASTPVLNPLITYARGNISTQSPYIGYSNPYSNTLGAMITIEGWGKRSAREAQAEAAINHTNAELVAESKAIETEAILTYIDTLRAKLLWQSLQEAINGLSKLNNTESNKYQVEFREGQKVLVNDIKYFSFSLMHLAGKNDQELPLPIGTLNIPPKNFNVNELINQAESKRADIAANKTAIESASANIEAIKSSKNIDFTPGVYYTQTPPYSSGGIGYGSQQTLSFLVSIPIPNNNFYDSDVVGAANALSQQEINLRAAKSKITVEINQTYLQYQSAKDWLEKANTAYVEAKKKRNGTLNNILSYRGVESELIDARTVHAKTMVLLERISGNFDVPNLD